MAYQPTTWNTGDVITAEKMNKLEQGVRDNQGAKGDPGAPGADGANGADGAAAGFGAPTATVDNNTGEPSVEVTASGPDTAKVFAFSFKNLKGEKGEQGEAGQDGAAGADGKDGAAGPAGADGKSAFEIWKEQPGNADKEVDDFLAALKGEKGDPGEAGQDGANGADGVGLTGSATAVTKISDTESASAGDIATKVNEIIDILIARGVCSATE